MAAITGAESQNLAAGQHVAQHARIEPGSSIGAPGLSSHKPRRRILPSRLALPSFNRDGIAFFIAGLLNNVIFTVYLSAAEDLMTSKAGVILLCNVLPGLLTKLALPLFAERLSYFSRVSATALSLAAACFGVASSSSTVVRLVCISTSSAAGALGEATFLSLTAHYNPCVLGYWSSGTGMAGLAGSVVYYWIHVVLGLSSSQTLFLIAPFALGLLASYLFVLTPSQTVLAQRRQSAYTELPSVQAGALDTDTTVRSGDCNAEVSAVGEDPRYTPVSFPPPPPGVSLERQAFPWLLSHYIVPLMLVYFCEYLINQGIAGTIDRFDDSPPPGLAARNHLYAFYQTAYQLGVFISRSSISLVQVPNISLLPVLQCANLLLMLACARWLLLPHRLFVALIMFWEGLVGGGMYVNTFYKIRRTLPREIKSWALGAASMGDAAGITLAAFVNIWLECAIRGARREKTCLPHGA